MAGKNYDEPQEMVIIKEFVRETFRSNVGVAIQEKTIVISAPSAALAGALRPHSHTLAELCQTDKRLIIRIG